MSLQAGNAGAAPAVADDASAGAQPVILEGRSVQLQGSRVARALLRLLGWKLEFDGLPSRQGVVVVYPHTSNWDFPIGLLAKWGIGLSVAFWAKDSLFRKPIFGRWMRHLGGVPVDRSAPKGIVPDMVERFVAARQRDEFFWLVLAPEGTRSLTEGWRSGFYRVAMGADVPVGLAHFDYGHKRIGITSFLQLSGSPEADMAEIGRRLGHCKGYRPGLAAPIRLS